MSDKQEQDWISSLFDGETLPAENEDTTPSLSPDEDQELLLQDFDQLRHMIRALPKETAPAGMADAVRQQIERQTLLPPAVSKSNVRYKRWTQITGAGVTTLCLFIGVLWFTQKSQFTTVRDFTTAEGLEIVATEAPVGVRPALTELHSEMVSGLAGTHTLSLADMTPPRPHVSFSTAESFESFSVVDFDSINANESPIDLLTDNYASVPKRRYASAWETQEEEDLPPALPVNPDLEAEVIAALNRSSKIPHKLKPGDLINYFPESENEIAVVELSVVDVVEACGQLQILLVDNDIDQSQELHRAQIADNEHAMGIAPKAVSSETRVKPSPATSSSNEDSALTRLQQPKESHPAASGNSNSLGLELESSLVAVYIDAPADKIVTSLTDMEQLEQVVEMHVGHAPQLIPQRYALLPNTVGSNSPRSLKSTTVEYDDDREDLLSPLVYGNTFSYSMNPAAGTSELVVRQRLSEVSPENSKFAFVVPPAGYGDVQIPEASSSDLTNTNIAKSLLPEAPNGYPKTAVNDDVNPSQRGSQFLVNLVPLSKNSAQGGIIDKNHYGTTLLPSTSSGFVPSNPNPFSGLSITSTPVASSSDMIKAKAVPAEAMQRKKVATQSTRLLILLTKKKAQKS